MPAPPATLCRSLLIALAVTCTGCNLLLLPHSPCLLYAGDFKNVHGYDEIGRGGNISRDNGVSYVLTFLRPQVVGRTDRTIDLFIDDPTGVSHLGRSGVSLFIRLPTPTRDTATCSTANGTLTALLVRDDEYLGDHPRLDPYGKRLPPKAEDAAALLDPARPPPPPGVYPLTGTIRVRAQGKYLVGFLEFHLDTRDPVPPNTPWLDRSADAPVSQADIAHWQSLRARPASAPPAPAHLRGRFQVEQCMDLL